MQSCKKQAKNGRQGTMDCTGWREGKRIFLLLSLRKLGQVTQLPRRQIQVKKQGFGKRVSPAERSCKGKKWFLIRSWWPHAQASCPPCQKQAFWGLSCDRVYGSECQFGRPWRSSTTMHIVILGEQLGVEASQLLARYSFSKVAHLDFDDYLIRVMYNWLKKWFVLYRICSLIGSYNWHTIRNFNNWRWKSVKHMVLASEIS